LGFLTLPWNLSSLLQHHHPKSIDLERYLSLGSYSFIHFNYVPRFNKSINMKVLALLLALAGCSLAVSSTVARDEFTDTEPNRTSLSNHPSPSPSLHLQLLRLLPPSLSLLVPQLPMPQQQLHKPHKRPDNKPPVLKCWLVKERQAMVMLVRVTACVVWLKHRAMLV
jgi:hypothetical protein